MLKAILSLILSLYVLLIPLRFGSPQLGTGVNPDPAPYLYDRAIEGYYYVQDDTVLPLRLVQPAAPQEGAVYPLLIFLHGSGERGDDNQKQVLRSLLDGVAENGTACYILMPQLHANGNWTDDDIDAALMAYLDTHLLPAYPIDENRLYITGNSRGGAGTFDQVLRHPGKYAAAMPVCGYHDSFGENPASYAAFADIPLWMGHSLYDPIVPSANSRGVYEAVTAMGGDAVFYSEYKSFAHNAWDPFYSDGAVWEWLFEQQLSES